MQDIKLSVDLSSINKYLNDMGKDNQIPFALATALNNIAREIQKQVRMDMQSHMNLRHAQYNLNAIKITSWAKKNNQTVEISVDKKYHWLTRMETGQDHIPFQGRQYLSVPNQEVFKNQIISSKNKLFIKNLNLHLNDKGETVGDQGTFIVKASSNSTPFIVQNLMQGRGKKRKENTRVLYTLVKRSKQPVKMHLIDIAQKILAGSLEPMINAALASTLRSAQAKGR